MYKPKINTSYEQVQLQQNRRILDLKSGSGMDGLLLMFSFCRALEVLLLCHFRVTVWLGTASRVSSGGYSQFR